jgi:predicted aspartyl protease
MVRNQPFVEVTINGRPTIALLDTGAAASWVDEDLAAELGIGALWKLAAEDRSGPYVRNDRTVPSVIGIGADVEEEVALGLIDVGAIVGELPEGEPRPRAIIGLDVLKKYVIGLDFDRSVVEFAPADGYTAFPPSGALTLNKNSGLRMLRVTLDGRDADAVIDTGATSAVHVSIAFEGVDALAAAQASQMLVSTVHGIHQRPIASLKNVEFAGRQFASVPATLSAQPIGNGVDAVVGMQLLSQFNLVLDFPRSRMWMSPNANFGKPFRRDRVGLHTLDEEGGRVVLVASGSPAEKAGFRIGDVVTEMRDETGGRIGSGRDVIAGQKVAVVMGDGSTRTLVAQDYY